MSHTVTINIEFNDRNALAAAVDSMKGQILGEGTHRVFTSQYTGFGFKLPNWSYPLVLQGNTLKYDNYNGAWGNAADIEKLAGRYAIEAARAKAIAEGWMSELQPNGSLLIYHPDGGTMTVSTDGSVDCAGFTGTGCDAAMVIENSIGSTKERSDKPDYFSEGANVRQGGR